MVLSTTSTYLRQSDTRRARSFSMTSKGKCKVSFVMVWPRRLQRELQVKVVTITTMVTIVIIK